MFQGHPNLITYGKYCQLTIYGLFLRRENAWLQPLVFCLTVICHQNVNNNNCVERLAVIFRHFPAPNALNNNKH